MSQHAIYGYHLPPSVVTQDDQQIHVKYFRIFRKNFERMQRETAIEIYDYFPPYDILTGMQGDHKI